MVEKVFWQDPYITTLDATITYQYDNQIMVDRTICFAFSGGQESDHGTINAYPILEAKKEGREILYTLPDEHNLVKGNQVFMQINWQRRYALMRLHFAAELVLECITHQYPSIEKIGAHIGQKKARIDFKWPHSFSEHIPALQTQVQAIVDQDHPIITAFSDKSQERRYWQIHGIAKVPCGGTHPKRSKEVGSLHLKRINLGKDKERIEITIQE